MVHMHSLKGMLCLGLSLSMLVVSSATVALADVNGVYQPMDGNNTWNNTSSAYSGFNNPGY
ncbi:MAG: hypothetical protein VKK59_07200, partial [Vampirovibrionales bacterium]|nr:hypothetical protein [Vampirovibrionales bacterium]